MLDKIQDILVKRDGVTPSEAEAQVQEARKALHEYLESGDAFSAECVCEEYFGLEPDYLEQLL